MLHPGLYEQLINRALRQELESIPVERKSVMPRGRRPGGCCYR